VTLVRVRYKMSGEVLLLNYNTYVWVRKQTKCILKNENVQRSNQRVVDMVQIWYVSVRKIKQRELREW